MWDKVNTSHSNDDSVRYFARLTMGCLCEYLLRMYSDVNGHIMSRSRIQSCCFASLDLRVHTFRLDIGGPTFGECQGCVIVGFPGSL